MGKKHSEVQISSKIGLASLCLCIVAMLLFSFSGGANSGAEILIGLILSLSCVGAAVSLHEKISPAGVIFLIALGAVRMLTPVFFSARVDCAVVSVSVVLSFLYAIVCFLRFFIRNKHNDMLEAFLSVGFGFLFLMTAADGVLSRVHSVEGLSQLPFLVVAAVLGLAAGILLLWKGRREPLKSDRKGRFKSPWVAGLVAFLSVTVTVFLVCNLLGTMMNYAFDTSEGKPLEMQVTAKQIDVHRKGPRDYELSFGAIRVDVPSDVYDRAKVGDVFLFYYHEGAFGIPYYELSQEYYE
ncbi:MAG: hypothetical protein J6C26_06855 [Clostridia bacterium]|nr:hypothetical protein [Clostridia bacterium]